MCLTRLYKNFYLKRKEAKVAYKVCYLHQNKLFSPIMNDTITLKNHSTEELLSIYGQCYKGFHMCKTKKDAEAYLVATFRSLAPLTILKMYYWGECAEGYIFTFPHDKIECIAATHVETTNNEIIYAINNGRKNVPVKN